MRTQILIAGHGGQGVVELGNYIAHEAIGKGFHVASTPTYGPETRGGKVKTYVIVSNEEIDSPIVENPDIIIVMNSPSMDFESELKSGGLMIINSSIIDKAPVRTDTRIVKVPATDLADNIISKVPQDILQGIKDTRFVANSVIFGTYLALLGINLDEIKLYRVLENIFSGKKASLIPLNIIAIKDGYSFIKA